MHELFKPLAEAAGQSSNAFEVGFGESAFADGSPVSSFSITSRSLLRSPVGKPPGGDRTGAGGRAVLGEDEPNGVRRAWDDERCAGRGDRRERDPRRSSLPEQPPRYEARSECEPLSARGGSEREPRLDQPVVDGSGTWNQVLPSATSTTRNITRAFTGGNGDDRTREVRSRVQDDIWNRTLSRSPRYRIPLDPSVRRILRRIPLRPRTHGQIRYLISEAKSKAQRKSPLNSTGAFSSSRNVTRSSRVRQYGPMSFPAR